MSSISVIVPALDESQGIAATLAALAPLRARGAELIVVDGGSRDATREIAAPLCDRVLEAPRGRAAQMNAGASASRGEILVFLHADSRLPEGALEAIESAFAAGRRAWGRFDVAIEGRSPLLAVVACAMNLRSRLTGIATGDQAIFVRREAFTRVGGFPPIPLMEDVAISSELKKVSRPACLAERVTTSGRRWESRGVLATVALMWRLRFAYALGADPHRLARRYDAGRPAS
ncbi:MAG TPA: TIGR04283 family arsenosugar biosynthesis glycosyltransferase [Usitatibacter sp.]|nr:TIGR04283 family arsenosugar biosynthesis glycosyltransferase [Usitatibacter sp.]